MSSPEEHVSQDGHEEDAESAASDDGSAYDGVSVSSSNPVTPEDVIEQGDDRRHGSVPVGRLSTGPCLTRRELNKRIQANQFRGYLRPHYRDLLEATRKEALRPGDYDVDPLAPSTVGGSKWTSLEKTILFSRLSSSGKGDTARLATDVGTKSEPEIRDYLTLLHAGSVEDYIKTRHDAGTELAEMATAVEVSATCEEQLENLARKLVTVEEKANREQAQDRFGKYWLLDTDCAQELEQLHSRADEERLQTAHEADQRIDEAATVSEASLLALPGWLELAQLFMSSDAEHKVSWVDLIENNDERPSIYLDAFKEFYDITMSLTKRLIQASIFQAMSRLRATDKHDPEQTVRHQDVQAACKIMEVDADWHRYWISLPRRLGLQVWTRGKALGNEKTGNSGYTLSYDQVEKALRGDLQDGDPEVGLSEDEDGSEPDDDEDDTSSTSYDSDFWTDTSGDDGLEEAQQRQMSEDDDRSDTDSDISRQGASRRSRDKIEDAYLEALDQRASSAAEMELWDIIKKLKKGQSQDVEMKLEDDSDQDTKLPTPPKRKRKTRDELDDWRDNVAYRPAWEAFEDLPGKDSFAQMGKRGQRNKERRLAKRRRQSERENRP